MTLPSGFDLFIRWWQIFVSIAFPIAVIVLLFLAWLDFHRWVNHRISREQEEERLANEVKEFIE